MGKLYDRHSRFIGYWNSNVVYDRHHRVKGYIQDNYMLDPYGSPLSFFYNNAFYTMNGVPWAFYDGNAVRDMSGRRLGKAGKNLSGLLSAGLLLGEGVGWYAPSDYNSNPRYAEKSNEPDQDVPGRYTINNPRENSQRPLSNNSYNARDDANGDRRIEAVNYEANNYAAPQNRTGFPGLGNFRVGDSMRGIMSKGKTVLNVVGALGGQDSTPYGGLKVIGNFAGRYFMSNPQAALSLLSRLSKIGLLK